MNPLFLLYLSWAHLASGTFAFVRSPLLLPLGTPPYTPPVAAAASSVTTTTVESLLELITSAPSNTATSSKLTEEILTVVRRLESRCPTADQDVLSALDGNWELLWTTQDTSSKESTRGPFLFPNWINPLENQAYSNNPSAASGRANPILPRGIQDALEDWGVLEPLDGNDQVNNKSSQAINLKKQLVRNVVRFTVPNPVRFLPIPLPLADTEKAGTRGIQGSLTVDARCVPHASDARRTDVRFRSCRVTTPLAKFVVPLGPVGPTGWLRTGYVDDAVRITRGHKGSVFVLSRTSRPKKQQQQ